MAEKGFRIISVAMRGARIYNYLGKTVEVYLHYNKDNRIPISPIRWTGGSENRANVLQLRPDSSPPCRMLPIAIACIEVDEADLDHEQAVVRPQAPLSTRVRPPARNRWSAHVRCKCRISRSTINAESCVNGSTHLGEE